MLDSPTALVWHVRLESSDWVEVLLVVNFGGQKIGPSATDSTWPFPTFPSSSPLPCGRVRNQTELPEIAQMNDRKRNIKQTSFNTVVLLNSFSLTKYFALKWTNLRVSYFTEQTLSLGYLCLTVLYLFARLFVCLFVLSFCFCYGQVSVLVTSCLEAFSWFLSEKTCKITWLYYRSQTVQTSWCGLNGAGWSHDLTGTLCRELGRAGWGGGGCQPILMRSLFKRQKQSAINLQKSSRSPHPMGWMGCAKM